MKPTEPIKRVRGRWYEAVAGPGLERETGSDDPDFAWFCAGFIEQRGKRRPEFIVRAGGEGGYLIGTCRTLDEAKALLIKSAGVTVVI